MIQSTLLKRSFATANKKIGFIGLGAMGMPMMKHCLNAGYDVTAYDVTDKALTEARNAGAKAVTDPSDCGRDVDFCLTMVPGNAEVKDIYRNHLFKVANKGTYLLNASTISPVLAKEISQEGQA